MAEIGTKIYFEKNTGNIILNLGDMKGFVTETTTEQDFENYETLKKYDKNAVGKIQLEYGEFGKLMEENKANSYKVDVSGKEPKLIFSWIDFNTGEPTERPKSEIESLQDEITKLKEEQAKSVMELTTMIAMSTMK